MSDWKTVFVVAMMALNASSAFGSMRFVIEPDPNGFVRLFKVRVNSCPNGDCSRDNRIQELVPRLPGDNRLVLTATFRSELGEAFASTPAYKTCVQNGGCRRGTTPGSFVTDELRLRAGNSDAFTLAACVRLAQAVREKPNAYLFTIYTSNPSFEPDAGPGTTVINAVVEGCELN